jgi:hypothetical protein
MSPEEVAKLQAASVKKTSGMEQRREMRALLDTFTDSPETYVAEAQQRGDARALEVPRPDFCGRSAVG